MTSNSRGRRMPRIGDNPSSGPWSRDAQGFTDATSLVAARCSV
jgi:hypothetical protein